MPIMEYASLSEIPVSEKLKIYFKENETREIYLVVIGANDGLTEDFLSKYVKKDNCIGLLVEPVKHIFNNLKKNFKSYKNLFFENSAIFERNCKKQFYGIKKSTKLPAWTAGLGSFNQKNILVHTNQVPQLKKYISKQEVSCITFETLIKKYSFPEINILQIDVEGYDFEIIKSIDFSKLRPGIIIVEILHLTIYESYSLISYLMQNNYTVYKNARSFDLFATDNQNPYNKKNTSEKKVNQV